MFSSSTWGVIHSVVKNYSFVQSHDVLYPTVYDQALHYLRCISQLPSLFLSYLPIGK